MTQVRLPIFEATPEPMDDRVRAFAGALRQAITGDVRLDRANRLLYATDASIYQMIPLAVVLPRSTDELAETVRTARRFHLPILPRGGGTSLAGQTVNHAVVIDCSFACNRIVDVDVDRRRVRVEPGVVLDDLNRALESHGLIFGPDVATASHANLGGMIGNNSAGAHSVLYGRTVDHVEALDVLLADGTTLHLDEGAADTDARAHAITAQLAGIVRPIAKTIRQRYPGTLRHVNGYALDRLLDQFEASTCGTFDRV
ncbi:MAG: FAD-binding oxidoreductase, partial [Phycisphaerales bacterium]|nr:FAD-binding oxidoreductase [Phycisphaerales bacterium]